ncbi:MAG: DUF3488 and transglutaminase-like domain-containing protein, partial [Actinobacteria bacterium]|nr:DUF3488 and transglutaminase-like domain-containing protein [Actinomycetota bacterium]
MTPAIMVGGIFTGVAGRVYAAVGALLGLALALAISRVRRPLLANGLIIAGVFAIGVLLVVPSGVGNVVRLVDAVSAARADGNVLRPPVPMSPGWQAIIGWLTGLIGFTTGWVALVVRRPATAFLLPLPMAGIAAISVPDIAQIPSGIAALALFALGLGLLSGSQSTSEGEARPSVAFEVRRTLKAIPLIAVITVALVLLSRADFLFPDPVIDPTREPQTPQTVPLSEVSDRVLFEVDSTVTGPWRIGTLDVYDGVDWRLPPFADNRLNPVPSSGVVNDELEPGVQATSTVRGLGGAVLPVLPNPVGIIAEGPRLAYDDRSDNIRAFEGSIRSGLSYTVTAAALPKVADLQKVSGEVPADVVQFTDIPPPPPAVEDLIRQAPGTSKWDQFDYLRTYVLEEVTVSGPGVPVSVTPQRVADMLTGNKEGSPYEIVAAQAMLARWVEVPSRIGYGFDGGEEVGDVLQIRPKHGASFVEVYFPGYGWLPVIGTPQNAQASLGQEGETQFDPSIIPSDEISVLLYLPVVVPPGSILGAQIRQAVAIAVAALVLLLLLYLTYPAVRKAIVRSRRRRAALAAGPRARIALAYSEWRDYATDYGYRFGTDTPLMFLDRFAPDEEHNEFAWLVTRALWGDLRGDVTPELAAIAEELSRTLRRRLAQAAPATLRGVAAVSRLAQRYPYAPE